jgi:hypothetical protein
MRAAGLLGPDEVPDAFHSTRVDGQEACAISGGKLLQLTPTGTDQMPIASITSVEVQKDGSVVATGDHTITCPFGPDEGGERFARMLKPDAPG